MTTLHDIERQCLELDAIFLEHGQIDWRLNFNGIVAELGEFLNELPFRPWRVSDAQAFSEKLRPSIKAYDEFADLLVTIIRVSLQAGLEPDEMQNAINRHFDRKWQRLENGIDK